MTLSFLPAVGLFKNRRDGSYLVQQYIEDFHRPGVYLIWRERTPISSSEMESRGLEIILGLLEHAEKRKPLESYRGLKETPSDRKKLRRYKLVEILRIDERRLEFDPSELRGDFVGSPKTERLQLHLPASQEEFLETLERAFDRGD